MASTMMRDTAPILSEILPTCFATRNGCVRRSGVWRVPAPLNLPCHSEPFGYAQRELREEPPRKAHRSQVDIWRNTPSVMFCLQALVGGGCLYAYTDSGEAGIALAPLRAGVFHRRLRSN